MYRTDIQYVNGQLTAKPTNAADVRRTLPELELTDRLASTAWDATIKSELAPFGYDDDPHLTSALSVQKRMAEMVQQFAVRRNKQRPDETQYTHLKRLSDDYDAAIKQASVSLDRTRNGLSNRLKQLQGEFESSIGFTMQDASDLRQVLRSASQEQRADYISSAIESGDGNLLAVILNSHPVTVGLTKDMQHAYRNQTMQRHRPDLLVLERNLQKTDRLVFDSFNDMLSITDLITASEARKHYEREIAEAKAAETREF